MQQILCGGAKGPGFLETLTSSIGSACTHDDLLLVNIKTATALIHNFHDDLQSSVRWDGHRGVWRDRISSTCFLQNKGLAGATGGGAWQRPDPTQKQAHSTTLTSISCQRSRPSSVYSFFHDWWCAWHMIGSNENVT